MRDQAMGPRAAAAATGVSADTLRHYERLGLLPRVARTTAGYRRYDARVIARVHLIQRAIVVGFSLKELASLLKRREAGDPPCQSVRALVAARLETLEQRLQQLEVLRTGMRVLLEDWDARLNVTPAGQRARLLDMLEGRPEFVQPSARVSLSQPIPVATARTMQPPSTLHTQFREAFNRHDVESVVALYEPDAILVTQNGPICGRDAIRAFYRHVFDSRPLLTLDTVTAQRVGELAMLKGQWRWTSRGKIGRRPMNEGRSVELLRLQADGTWLFVIDNPSVC